MLLNTTALVLGQIGTGETGLLIFMGLFAVVVVYTFRRKNQKTFDEAAQLPLDHDEAQPRLPQEQARNPRDETNEDSHMEARALSQEGIR